MSRYCQKRNLSSFSPHSPRRLLQQPSRCIHTRLIILRIQTLKGSGHFVSVFFFGCIPFFLLPIERPIGEEGTNKGISLAKQAHFAIIFTELLPIRTVTFIAAFPLTGDRIGRLFCISTGVRRRKTHLTPQCQCVRSPYPE